MKAAERRALERLYARRYTEKAGFSLDQAWELCSLSRNLGKQIGLLINRQAKVECVILGTASRLLIPALGRSRLGQSRLRGLGLLHTHLANEEISQEDLMDLLFLRLDYLSILQADKTGAPKYFQYSHLMPSPELPEPYYISPLLNWDKAEIDLRAHIESIEDEMFAKQGEKPPGKTFFQPQCCSFQNKKDSLSKHPAAANNHLSKPHPRQYPGSRAILASVSKSPRKIQERYLAELADLAESAGVEVCKKIFYRPTEQRGNSRRLLLGEDRLAELEVLALKSRADMIIFDGELSSAQIDNLARTTERKVLDRTMLILDIFAQHASSRAGKLQVEMAQLEYVLPRLSGSNAGRAMDRLAGGIGGRGPGETKLELDRRKIRSRIAKIKLELKDISRQRELSRSLREKASLPVVCLVGYTNTGKSTLLNTLTQSAVYVENQLFATLDSTARRLYIPCTSGGEQAQRGNESNHHTYRNSPINQNGGKEVIIIDTVGFIRDLPASLRDAFTATLEELNSASLFLHVADASHPDLDLQVESVRSILSELNLDSIPNLLALNKWDLLSSQKTIAASEDDCTEKILVILKRYPQAVPISADAGLGLDFLVQKIGQMLRAACAPEQNETKFVQVSKQSNLPLDFSEK